MHVLTLKMMSDGRSGGMKTSLFRSRRIRNERFDSDQDRQL